MRYSRLSANLLGIVLVPGLLISACGDDATTSGTEPCSGADCAGAPSVTGGTKADNTSGKTGNTSGGAGTGVGGDAAAGDTSVDPGGGSGTAGDAGANQGGISSGGVGGQPDPVELLGDGATCEDDEQCGSGYCTDGVCCESKCDDGCYSCLGAETGDDDGQCSPVTSGTDPGDDCAADTASCQSGVCNGSGACNKVEDGTICREAEGACDVAEVCTNGACAADVVKDAETSCRASAGECDIAELCNGLDKTCPTDVFSTASVEACPGYKCSGASAACPSSCQTKADCSPARFCNENQCVIGKRIFVTSTTHAANFGALTNADAICNARAQEAGLFGTYMAWVSSTTSNIATRSAQSTFKYYRLDGTTPYVIANDWADLINGTTVAIATDENGIVRGNAPVFTGTESNGTVATNNCQNWSTTAVNVTFATGNSSAAATNVPNWSHYWDYNCSTLARFYCVQQ
jgi:Protein of unknown function (DUF1554)